METELYCGAQHGYYKKTFCLQGTRFHRGQPHRGRGPRGYWVEWDDSQTKEVEFWTMIQILTDRVKVRHLREDKRRYEQAYQETRSRETWKNNCGSTRGWKRNHPRAGQEYYDHGRGTQEKTAHCSPSEQGQ